MCKSSGERRVSTWVLSALQLHTAYSVYQIGIRCGLVLRGVFRTTSPCPTSLNCHITQREDSVGSIIDSRQTPNRRLSKRTNLGGARIATHTSVASGGCNQDPVAGSSRSWLRVNRAVQTPSPAETSLSYKTRPSPLSPPPPVPQFTLLFFPKHQYTNTRPR